MASDEVLERLDRLTAILRLAHRDAINQARASIRGDKINASILDATAKWSAAAKMQTAVEKKTKAAKRTVQDRIADLLEQGVLEKRGGGPTTEYRATGLI